MGYDYALVHLKYNIPLAIGLTLLYRPFFIRFDAYKIAFNIIIAVLATTPWDSYLIRRKIWTYPSHAVIGSTLFSIPAEEYFFFVVQTYNTGLLYLLLSKPVFHSSLLDARKNVFQHQRILGQVFISTVMGIGFLLVWAGGKGLYLGLILAWAGPFALFLWSLAYQFLIKLPLSSTLLPVALSTSYLWAVDTFELRKGTWAIETGTKLGIHVWDGLEVEEAIFFLVTNILIVFGMVAVDNAFAVVVTFPSLFPAGIPSTITLLKGILLSVSKYDTKRMHGIQNGIERLQKKSRSFYLASAVFPAALRIDLTLLYSFCRMADDLVDDAETTEEARDWISKLQKYFDQVYKPMDNGLSMPMDRMPMDPILSQYIFQNFPENCQPALEHLPTQAISATPFHDLLKGFNTDLAFQNGVFPIETEYDLEKYALRVAGTVAEMCLELVYYHTSSDIGSHDQKKHITDCAGRMGVALQYVNIARDIQTDAKMRRVYIPTTWLKETGLQPLDIIENPKGPRVDALRNRLLDIAFAEYGEARKAIEKLPADGRAPIRVAVESYMEIGRVLREKGFATKKGRATVPKSRRLKVALLALSQR